MGGQIPGAPFALDEWGGFGLQRWVRADPDLVAFAEFSSELDWQAPKLKAGFREWPATPDGGATISFSHYPDPGSLRLFGRLRMIYLGAW